MRILAVDLGKVKSVACDYASETGEQVFETCRTAPDALEAMFVRRRPDRVVIESRTRSGTGGLESRHRKEFDRHDGSPVRPWSLELD